MYDNETVQAEKVINVLHNLLDQAKKIEVMLKMFALTSAEDEAPPMSILLMDGVGKGTEATIYSIFYRLFHESKHRDAMLKKVGLNRELYMETAEKIAAINESGGAPPQIDDLLNMGMGNKH